MSFYGEGILRRRADVLRHEANELAGCITALAALAIRRPDSTGDYITNSAPTIGRSQEDK